MKPILPALFFAAFVGAAAAQPTSPPPPPPLAQPSAAPTAAVAPSAPPPPPATVAPVRSGATIERDGEEEERPEPEFKGPIRSHRHFGILGELSWSGLAGFGLNGVYNITPHIAVDAGLGIGLAGWKTGLRGRYNFLLSHATPFVGAGIDVGWGTGNRVATLGTTEGNEYDLKLGPMPYLQMVGGLDFTAGGGFTLIATAGYSVLLSNNAVVTRGAPTSTQVEGLNLIYGSGIVLGIALGYTF